MSRFDARGCAITGATTAALQTFERALAAFQAWRGGADVLVAQALREAPGFVMAHVLQAWLLVGGRDPRRVRSAQPVLARAALLPANEREQAQLAAVAAVLADDYEAAKARLGELLLLHPRDALALQVAHALDYVTGDVQRLRDRVAAVLPAWTGDLPGHHAVLAMHAFGLEESGEYERAEHAARAALALNPWDARAHHVMAHVFEMTGRAAAGVRWLNEHIAWWAEDTVVARHCWWHLALFELAQGEPRGALCTYDRRVRASRPADIADLIDAAALLWLLQLQGCDAGARWAELVHAWAPHVDDRFCSFNDLHAMLAFVGARDWANAHRLEITLACNQARQTRYGETTRLLGLPACRALIAFGRGNNSLAISLLERLKPAAHRLGGSHAQRSVLRQTLLHAIDRGRSASRGRGVVSRGEGRAAAITYP